jgi:hypothetical protein
MEKITIKEKIKKIVKCRLGRNEISDDVLDTFFVAAVIYTDTESYKKNNVISNSALIIQHMIVMCLGRLCLDSHDEITLIQANQQYLTETQNLQIMRTAQRG